MEPRRFDDVELGDELPELRPDVSMEKVRLFCETTRMLHDRFLDHEKAKAQGLPSAIVPGIMSQGILSAMIHAWAPGCRIERLDTVFRAPIQVDSAPVCRAAITDTDEETRRIELDLTIVNEAGETRVVGTANVSLG